MKTKSDVIDFLIIEKLSTQPHQYYLATNGIRLVLAADMETVWFVVTPPRNLIEEEIHAACDEFIRP